jgi:4-amino-4-deoxy-L-arabinose transferase-like glycosyltransferase
MSRRLEIALVLALIAGGTALRWRIGHAWLYAGSDTYGYIKLGDELLRHGRYALGPLDPLHQGRTPLYSIYIAAVKGEHPALMSGGEGWFYITYPQIALELLSLPLLYWLARRLAGARAALAALACAALLPLSYVYDSAVLTESLATTLTTLLFVVLLLGEAGERRPAGTRLRFALAGALVGLSTLLRPDGVLLFVPLGLALWKLPSREVAPRDARSPSAQGSSRLVAAALALAAFAVTFGPWPVRNLIQFHKPYPFGMRVDRWSHPVPNDGGYWRWMSTWGDDHGPYTLLESYFYTGQGPLLTVTYPRFAFDSVDEEREIQTLFDRRMREGLTPSLSRAFDAVATKRELRHPIRVFLWLPLQRAYHMWITPFEELESHPTLWSFIRVTTHPLRLPMMIALVLGMIVGSVGLWLGGAKTAALVIGGWLVVRTGFLAFTMHSMPRYVCQAIPIGFVVAVCGVTLLLRRIK